jgi:hypothetical protein
MIRKSQRRHQWVKWPLAAAVAASMSAPAHAFQFMLGEIEGSLDTTLTAGASWRTEDRDQNQLAQGNLGPSFAYSTTGSSTSSADNGNWNFEEGKTYSKIVKGTSDLLLSYENMGGFTRARYFYDFELVDEERAFDNVGQTRPLSKDALDDAGAAVDILDAYVWFDAELGETPINLRLGRQVLSWGESTFLFGGASVINPIDVSAARAPGAEVKDVLLPVNMFYTSIGLSESLTGEFFYQLQWEKTKPDQCGTFFSNSDVGADGCGPIYLGGQTPESIVDAQGLYVSRVGDDEPDNDGQFGVAMRWYAAELGDSEFGFYYIQYHSRLPFATFIVNDPNNGRPLSNYYVEYPEDLQSFTVSFNTSTEGGWSVGGEISLRPDTPVARNGFELVAASNAFSSSDTTYAAFQGQALAAGPGGILKGYDELDVWQAQVTFIKFFDQILGASRLTFVTELGMIYVDGVPENSRLGRDSTYGVGPTLNPNATTTCEQPGGNINRTFCEEEGFTTEFSAGYRIRTSLDYSDVFAGVNLSPTLVWSHDVTGYAPEPAGLFREDAMAVGLSVRADYLNKYSATVGYTSFFGGEPYNFLNDRDNVSASVAVSF